MRAVGVISPFYRQIGKGRGMDCLRGMPFPNLKPPVRERVKTEKGGCPALFGGLFTFARSFLSPGAVSKARQASVLWIRRVPRT